MVQVMSVVMNLFTVYCVVYNMSFACEFNAMIFTEVNVWHLFEL